MVRQMLVVSVVGLAVMGCVETVDTPVAGPRAAVVGQEVYFSGELIYPLDGRPTPECHASTIVETPLAADSSCTGKMPVPREGETALALVAAWFGGTREGNADVGIWLSRHEDGVWSRPVQIATGVESPNTRYPCWNPVLFRPRSGPLMLFYKVGPSPSRWWGMLTTSEDDGRTWSRPRRLGSGPLGHLIGPVKNKPIELADGSILCPSSSEHDGWRVHFEITEDLGRTWRTIGPINDGREFGAIQPSILRYADGRMQVLCRSRQGVIVQSWSQDGGETWGKMTATTLLNPNAGTDAVTLRDGRQLLVYNHTVRGGPFPSGRNMLNVAISTDGVGFRPVVTLERSEGEFSYPAVIQDSGGRVHITYTYRRQSIKHVVLDPARIP